MKKSDALRGRVLRAIAREEQCCFDVCAETGQIFHNVKHMSWFHQAVADWFRDNTRKWEGT